MILRWLIGLFQRNRVNPAKGRRPDPNPKKRQANWPWRKPFV